MATNNGGPAFPRAHGHKMAMHTKELSSEGQEGMSLLDWFAGQALMGYLAAFATEKLNFPDDLKIAGWCYDTADRMIEEREKRNAPPPL